MCIAISCPPPTLQRWPGLGQGAKQEGLLAVPRRESDARDLEQRPQELPVNADLRGTRGE